MSLPERREPDGISGQQEQSQAQTAAGTTTCVGVQTNLSSFTDDTDDLCQRLSESSIGDDNSKVQDIPVCLHPGQQGGSPVLITLPFQNPDTLQTFVPCGLCHRPGIVRESGVVPSDTLAFCVCEVNIQTAQLTLVPCFLCWQPNSDIEIPNKITVPLFPTLHSGTGAGSSEPEVRFVPCSLCLQPDHRHDASDLVQEEEEEHVAPVTEEDENPGLTSWFIPFSNVRSRLNTSLQMAFILRCGNIIRQSRQRQREISQVAKARQKKVSIAQQRRLAKYLHSSRSRKPVLKQPVNFTHKVMREQTERIYKKLPEVKESQKQRLKEQLQHSHKLMAYIFQKRLQRATLQGKVSWKITESCI